MLAIGKRSYKLRIKLQETDGKSRLSVAPCEPGINLLPPLFRVCYYVR